MPQLIVPAAGRSSRFGSPKLLATIGGERVIDRTLRHAAAFDSVMVLTGEDLGVPRQRIIHPGTGSAGGLREVLHELADDVTVIWSDIVLCGPTLDELLQQPLVTGLAPYVPEVRPYCHLQLDGAHVARADYSRPLIGNHDQGVFRFRGETLRWALQACPAENLLQCFEAMYGAGVPVNAYRTSYPTLGFNDPEKLEWIRSQL